MYYHKMNNLTKTYWQLFITKTYAVQASFSAKLTPAEFYQKCPQMWAMQSEKCIQVSSAICNLRTRSGNIQQDKLL